ncbi:Hypothetical protein LUCI_4967 [Lucifera butyrica]|uniref:Uncharacterized protein n=1 Tax=Lucifera butyrica TaxID=1351585 RepID=A0A498REB3_9FIRM|nr:hypothetical protein [Lucifera butyrica]VBB09669.1 Hypothetical protein LUCI_4967 [Lucifera butyrica]
MADKVECICSQFEEINGFYSIYEFERFQKYLEGIVRTGDMKEVPVQEYYATFQEKWFECDNCSQIWRLVYPDFPFKGLWNKME